MDEDDYDEDDYDEDDEGSNHNTIVGSEEGAVISVFKVIVTFVVVFTYLCSS